MSRRDTIIVAMLINAGLLTLLFATAMNTDDDDLFAKGQREQLKSDERMLVQPTLETPPTRDVVDQAIQTYRTEHSPATVAVQVNEKTTTPPKVEVKSDTVVVSVKQGDNLEKIANANGTTVRVLMKVNGLKNTKLSVGQKLRVPLPNTAAAERPPAPVTESEKVAEYYTVQSGDNPWVISRRTGINYEEIIRLNQLTEEKARRLRPGDQLRIR